MRVPYENIPPSPRVPQSYSLTLPKPRWAKTFMLLAFISRVSSARIGEPIPAEIGKMYLNMRQEHLSASVGKDVADQLTELSQRTIFSEKLLQTIESDQVAPSRN